MVLTLLTQLLGFEISTSYLPVFTQSKPQTSSVAKITGKKGHLPKSQAEALNLSSLLPRLFGVFTSFHISFLSFSKDEASKFRRMF